MGGKGASAMQPAASALEGVKLVKGEVGRILGGEAVNERRWGDVREEKVGVDEVSGSVGLGWVLVWGMGDGGWGIFFVG